ncbi:hypothetical protein PHET_08587 [Paragonimus heterotremus]|uniref:Uncharacterized protein n=1 Tax=Paragonimus heterotremus TaxID=100268 RepID=A0A8J4SJ08_9TREM|nr:hypothetical protein PHET_08587 [Paragonimus heterotremus]
MNLKPVGYNLSCYSYRVNEALKRHHVHILGMGNSPNAVYLDCPVCPYEDLDDFEWRFIPRETAGPIFVKGETHLFDNVYVLKPDLLGEVPVVDEKRQCLIPKSNDLYLSEIVLEKHTGTYVCIHKRNKTHPTNFVWYHLDNINRPQAHKITSMSVPDLTKVENYEQLVQLQALARRDLLDYSGWSDRSVGPFTMTTKLIEDDIYIGQCGQLKVGQERQCYITIPAIEPNYYNKTEHMYTYRILRDAFDFLVSARGVTGQSGGRRVQSVFREQMKNLEFDFHGNGSHLYIPCGFSLFKHLFDFTDEIKGFPGPSYRVEITYDVACIDAGSEKFIEMARMSDFSQMNWSIPVLREFRYTKVQRIVYAGEEGLLLKCPTHEPLTCNATYADALWKSGNDLTFNERRVKTENIYTTPECDLYFEVAHYYDMDIYYCYLRDPIKPNEVWSRLPRIAYQLQMEKATFKWPRENDVYVGIVILTAWSLFLSSLWILLSLYDSVTREHALFEATVKQAGGRMARLKQVYSPFSDEDRGLFFKIMQNEV